MALTFATHLVTATTDRSLTAGGAVTFAAKRLLAVQGPGRRRASPAGRTRPHAAGRRAGRQQRGFADDSAAANGARGARDARHPECGDQRRRHQRRGRDRGQPGHTPGAGVPACWHCRDAGGLLTLSAIGESDAEATADGTAVTGSTDATVIGAGVAINLATVLTEASVGALAVVLSLGLAFTAQTGGSAGSGADSVNTFKAAAASGAGGGDVGWRDRSRSTWSI